MPVPLSFYSVKRAHFRVQILIFMDKLVYILFNVKVDFKSVFLCRQSCTGEMVSGQR